MAQLLLFPDPRPLVERLGTDFFRQVPEVPGVYLMRDAGEAVLYVGKAKNLRQRLRSYRVANPERLPRRHLRLLRAVKRIELQECADEAAALKRESELLLELKPRFNRAGTWPSPPWYLAWRCLDRRLEFVITEQPEEGWQAFGPRSRRGLVVLRLLLTRLLWCVLNPDVGITTMPPGWVHGSFHDRTVVPWLGEAEEVITAVMNLLTGNAADFIARLSTRLPHDLHPFTKAAIAADVEQLAELV